VGEGRVGVKAGAGVGEGRVGVGVGVGVGRGGTGIGGGGLAVGLNLGGRAGWGLGARSSGVFSASAGWIRVKSV
jgi:hypothetical protein